MGYAIVANTLDIALNSGCVIDSYRSGQGAYGGSNVYAHGNVRADFGITVNGGATVNGTVDAFDPSNYPLQALPATYTDLGDLTISGTYTLAAGDYRVNALNMNGGNPVLAVTGNVRIWFNSLVLAGTVGGNSTQANRLWFFSRSGSTGQVNLNGSGSAFSMVAYAPNLPVVFSGTGTFYGAVVGSQINLNANIQYHYDEDLGAGCLGVAPVRLALDAKGPVPNRWLPGGETLVAVPNPGKGMAYAVFKLQQGGDTELLLHDLSGKLIWDHPLGELNGGIHSAPLETRALAPGLYILSLQQRSSMGTTTLGRFKWAVIQ